MSSPFIRDAETVDITVPCLCAGKHESDTVTVKARLTGMDLSIIDGAMFVANEEGRIQADMGAANRAMMERGVVGWSFVDEAGSPIPFNTGWVNDLDAAIWNVVCTDLGDRLSLIRNPTKATEDVAKRLGRRHTRNGSKESASAGSQAPTAS